MKRKRKWWFWLLIALSCVIVVFAIAELTGASVASILGWGALGVIGFVGLMLALMLAAVFLVAPAAGIIWWLLRVLISNKEIRFITLGSLGFCAVLVGWILTIRQAGWSLLVVMVGFALGCLTGVEYQQHSLSSANESARKLEQAPDERKGGDI